MNKTHRYTIIFLLSIILLVLFNPFFINGRENMKNNSEKIFISFADGGPSYLNALDEIAKNAREIDIFKEVKTFTDDDLKKDTVFWDKHHEFIENNKRGHGYWLWKSYVNKMMCDLYPLGTCILYADAGCELNNKSGIIEMLDSLEHKDMVVYDMAHIEETWSKMDLIINMSAIEYANTRQIFATTFCYKITDQTRKFCNEWYSICCDYHNIDDTPSISQNAISFKEHRHDQSVFSLLCKKYGISPHDQRCPIDLYQERYVNMHKK